MNTKVFNSLLLVVCGILFCLILGNIDGKWTGNIVCKGVNIPMSFTFKASDGKLTGTTETSSGITQIMDGRVDKDQMTFKANLNGDISTCSAHLFADSINMRIVYQGANFTTTLKRNSLH